MTEKILNLVTDFLKTNNIEGLDIEKIIKNLPVDEIMAMVTGKDEYVVKRSGNLEKYNDEKISRSIKNAADRSDMQINSSDLNLILKDVAGSLFGDGKSRVRKTTDVRDIVLEVLANQGFSKIRDAYDTYSKNQN